jgi:hypothetical protein
VFSLSTVHEQEERDPMRTLITTVCALALVLALATTAFGQSSADGYSDQGGQVLSAVDQGGGGSGGSVAGTPTSTATDESGSLPFTGLDIGLLAVAGAVLALAGLCMRRLTRSPGAA